MNAETAMARGFKNAGYRTAAEDLEAWAELAWRRWSAKDKHVERMRFLDECFFATKEGRAAHEMMEQWQPGAWKMAKALVLNRSKKKIQHLPRDAGAKPVSGGSPISSDTHAVNAPAATHASPQPNDWQAAARRASAKMSSSAPKVGLAKLAEAAVKDARASRARGDTVVELHRLDMVMVHGTPIRHCTVFEVRNWIKEREQDHHASGRDVKWARNLVANLDGNVVIGHFWTDDKLADQLFDRAESDQFAAQKAEDERYAKG